MSERRLMTVLVLLLLLVLGSVHPSGFAVGHSGAGGQVQSPQQQVSPEDYAKALEAPARVERLQVSRVVAALGLKPGMTVADLGAGSGLLARPIAKAVAPGTVYAVDIQRELLSILDKSARDAGVANIVTVLGDAGDPKLREPVDLLLICDALHHIANPAAYLKAIRKYQAPGGRLAVIDYARNWPEGHEKMQFSRAQFEGWMKDAGWAAVAWHDWVEDSFFAIYR
jgi:cyclopropane fatty-acyl-phospholipid synthase-like methyltransferase